MRRVAVYLLVKLCETAAMFVFQNIHCSRPASLFVVYIVLYYIVFKAVNAWVSGLLVEPGSENRAISPNRSASGCISGGQFGRCA